MKKILGISGSPNAGGNTSYSVQYALNVLKEERFETKYISLSGRKINPCTGCWECSKTGKCVFQDDMEEICEAMLWCGGLIIGSPVYFGLLSGQLKVMMDRCAVLRPDYGNILPMAGKTGAAIACANSRSGGQETTLQNIQTFLLQMNMRVVSDGPKYCHSGGTIMGTAKDDAWGLETVRGTALNVGKMLTSK